MIRILLGVLIATASLAAVEQWQGLEGGADSAVAFLDYDGTNLTALGSFNAIGGQAIHYAGRRTGTTWAAMGNPSWGGAPSAYLRTAGGTVIVAAPSSGGGPLTYALYNWNGSSWVTYSVGGVFNSVVYGLAETSDGVYAVGDFTTVTGIVTARRIARYAGGAWSEVGGGLNSGTCYAVAADPVSGVVVGGDFTMAGAVSAAGLARWSGSAWSAYGTGANGRVRSLAFLTTTDLYVGGEFTSVAGVATDSGVARYQSLSGWQGLNGRSTTGFVRMTVRSDGRVYVCHNSGVDVFNGSTWSTKNTGGQVQTVTCDGLTGTFYAGGAWTTNATLGTPRIAKWDATPPVISLSALDDTALEGGGTATVRATLSSVATADVLLALTRSGGTATSADYVALAVPIVIPAGSLTQDILVTAFDDTEREGDESLMLDIGGGGSGFSLGGTTSVALWMQDNDASLDPTASVTVTDATADELTGSTGTFRITLSAPALAVTHVAYTLSGTATNSVDYVALNGDATFAIGATAKTVTITPLNDSTLEGAEQVILYLSAGTGYQIGAPASGGVVISDDEAVGVVPTVTLSVTDDTAMENDMGNTAVFTFTVSPPQDAVLPVLFARSGTAAMNSDYGNIGAGVNIQPGFAMASVSIVAVDNAVMAGSKTVGLQLTASGAYTIGTAGVQAATILDDESIIPVATLVATDPDASEGGDTATFTITFSQPLASSIVLSLSTAASPSPTATGNVDYTIVTVLPFNVPAGATSHTIVIAATTDAVVEGDEYITFFLPPTTASVVRGSPYQATVTIHNTAAISGGGGAPTASSGGGGGCGGGGALAVLTCCGLLVRLRRR